jgi:transposase
MKKQHASEFKARVVPEALKEERTYAQIASDFGVHPTRISQWKAAYLESPPSLFERKESKLCAERAANKKRYVNSTRKSVV